MTRENACSYRKISRPKLNTAARSTVENHVALFTVDVTCRLIYDSCAIDCTYVIVSFFCRQSNLVIEHTLYPSSPLKSDASSVGSILDSLATFLQNLGNYIIDVMHGKI